MRRLLLICLALLPAGCYDSRFGEPGNTAEAPAVNSTIARLNALYAGTTFPVTGEVIVEGRITANGDNFYRTLCIEQDGAGMEVLANVDQLHNDFPVGCRVTMYLRGVALGQNYGVLQAGTMPLSGSSYAVDYIPSKPALDKILARSSGQPEPIVPTVRNLGELTEKMCGTLVRIDGLYYTPEDLTSGTWTGYKRFTDTAGTEIYTYVRTYASFAAATVPTGRCSLTGILQYDGRRFILKLRNESDCTL